MIKTLKGVRLFAPECFKNPPPGKDSFSERGGPVFSRLVFQKSAPRKKTVFPRAGPSSRAWCFKNPPPGKDSFSESGPVFSRLVFQKSAPRKRQFFREWARLLALGVSKIRPQEKTVFPRAGPSSRAWCFKNPPPKESFLPRGGSASRAKTLMFQKSAPERQFLPRGGPPLAQKPWCFKKRLPNNVYPLSLIPISRLQQSEDASRRGLPPSVHPSVRPVPPFQPAKTKKLCPPFLCAKTTLMFQKSPTQDWSRARKTSASLPSGTPASLPKYIEQTNKRGR